MNKSNASTIISKCDVCNCNMMRDLICINPMQPMPKYLCFAHFEQYRSQHEWHDIKRKEIVDRAVNQQLEKTREIVTKQNPLYATHQKLN